MSDQEQRSTTEQDSVDEAATVTDGVAVGQRVTSPDVRPTRPEAAVPPPRAESLIAPEHPGAAAPEPPAAAVSEPPAPPPPAPEQQAPTRAAEPGSPSVP